MKNLKKKLVTDQTDKTQIQLFRYIFTGGAAFIIDFSSLFILTDFFGIYYLASAAIAFVLGLITNYMLSINWVFNRRTMSNRKLEFGVFALIGIVGILLNELFIWFFTENLQIYYLLSKIMAAVIILFWNFFARKFVLFK
ncbi:MAG: GtrA family protein [Methanobacterium sp.]|jgi:putative flippase GtrA|uniref:GtrA family protein n=2 Tax=Methanobacteriaceae TaxID=2159 RepID=A0A2H4VTH8_9EURY|nr:polysaccharide synthesis protein GtrA [Methanobacterium subterraneum]MCC7558912.1 GtrA family protein [Methanobacterium sp.]NMO10338.1 GtrA family protein [Methanobacterium subterraneum]